MIDVAVLAGKSPDEILATLREKKPRRSDLEQLVVRICACEPTLSTKQVAQIRGGKNPKTIERLVRNGKLRAFRWTDTYDIPVSAVRELDRATEVNGSD